MRYVPGLNTAKAGAANPLKIWLTVFPNQTLRIESIKTSNGQYLSATWLALSLRYSADEQRHWRKLTWCQ